MHDQLVLGIDGGGTKTVAWLATCCASGETPVVGRGLAGPVNPQTVGFDAAMENLDLAVAAAFKDAAAQRGPVAAAVLGLAGSDRDENRQAFGHWARQRRLADRFRVVHDALPVLAIASPPGCGIALICGTGSLAFGSNRDARVARAGGWGFLFGDEGSGYAIARAGLRAAAKAADGRAPETRLLPAMLRRFDLKEPPQLIPAVYRIADDRGEVAALAEVVTQAAGENDPTAGRILDDAAGELAAMVSAVAGKLFSRREPISLALAGGVLLGAECLQTRLSDRLAALKLNLEPVVRVPDPVVGAVRLAQSLAAGDWPPGLARAVPSRTIDR
ncbi:MAG: N-acetylglucosamine kinase [Pirellulales bacterium]|nr:N-acetylglucosamine kinase [Pirellulales bacterium]